MYIPPTVTEPQARAWCHYVASLHTTHTTMGNAVALPISPKCTRQRTPSDMGCGTCYPCTEQIIIRALFTATPINEHTKLPDKAKAINAAVFAYVSGLDQRLACDGDYTPMTSEQYARVMNWAASFVRQPVPAAQPRMYGAPAAAHR